MMMVLTGVAGIAPLRRGGRSVVQVDVMFWGDRGGQLRHPFGVSWAMNAPVGK